MQRSPGQNGGEGAEVIYALRNKDTLSNLILNNLENSGQKIRDAYQRRLPSNTSKDYYFIHRDTPNTEAIIVEYGFLDNANDANRLKNNYRQYVDAVVNAILSYIGKNESDYIVKSGDSLYSIALKYNVTVQSIKDANNLTSNTLKIGQKLIIPTTNEQVSEKNTYTVKKGDSLYTIASEYNTTVQELIDLNNLKSNNLSIGQVLKLPVKETETIPVIENTYTVKKGDSLYTIASKYNTTVSELKQINNLSTNNLSIGQILLVPTLSENIEYELYTVKPKDNLYNIANAYNVTVDEIKQLNNLTTNNLSINQQLKIPTKVIDSEIYSVKSGDSLYSIAKKFNTTVDKLKQLNNLTSNLLNLNQKLIIKE